MKKIFCSLMLAAATLLGGSEALACTNFIITRGASTEGSILVTYAADSPQLYGCHYKHNATKYKAGTMLPVTEWATGKS